MIRARRNKGLTLYAKPASRERGQPAVVESGALRHA